MPITERCAENCRAYLRNHRVQPLSRGHDDVAEYPHDPAQEGQQEEEEDDDAEGGKAIAEDAAPLRLRDVDLDRLCRGRLRGVVWQGRVRGRVWMWGLWGRVWLCWRGLGHRRNRAWREQHRHEGRPSPGRGVCRIGGQDLHRWRRLRQRPAVQQVAAIGAIGHGEIGGISDAQLAHLVIVASWALRSTPGARGPGVKG